MMIAVANSKGGVGKSTLAGLLTGMLHRTGQSVILADSDRQGSSSEWIREALPDVRVERLETSDAIFNELPGLGREADFVVCDGPGSDTDVSRALLLWADLALLPCKASVFEARALAENVAFVRHAQLVRRGAPRAVAVLSMVGKRFRLTRSMLEASQALQIDVAETQLTLRQAYADAPGQASFPWLMGPQEETAAAEFGQLFQELLPNVSDVGTGLSARPRKVANIGGVR